MSLMSGQEHHENDGIINRNEKFKRKEPNLRKKNDKLRYSTFDITQDIT